MVESAGNNRIQATARGAGALYLLIIVCGIYAEFFVRGALIVAGDAAATATNIAADPLLFQSAIAAELVMVSADVALAWALWMLFRPVAPGLALLAAFFRLAQAAVLAVNLLNPVVVMLLMGGGAYLTAFSGAERDAFMMLALDAHKHGYYIGLVFFALHCLLLGGMIWRTSLLPRALGVLVIVAGVAYGAASFGVFLFPEHEPAISNSPLYLVPVIVAEFALCFWLLLRGVNVAGRASFRDAG